MWLERTGLANFGILFAIAIIWFLIPGDFALWTSLLLFGFFCGLNWYPIKDLINLDENIEDGKEKVKKIFKKK